MREASKQPHFSSSRGKEEETEQEVTQFRLFPFTAERKIDKSEKKGFEHIGSRVSAQSFLLTFLVMKVEVLCPCSLSWVFFLGFFFMAALKNWSDLLSSTPSKF